MDKDKERGDQNKEEGVMVRPATRRRADTTTKSVKATAARNSKEKRDRRK